MGGYGSGRRNTRDTAENYRALDIRVLKKFGKLDCNGISICKWESGSKIALDFDGDRIWLDYSIRYPSGDKEPYTYAVLLERTPCALGGERVWFRCPGRGCGRRVAILYGGAVFACRRCHDLAYESQQEDACYRALRRAQNLRVRLGGTGSLADLFPEKPKGMHWATYSRLAQRGRLLDARANQPPPFLLRGMAKHGFKV